jgi:hypothetical protein
MTSVTIIIALSCLGGVCLLGLLAVVRTERIVRNAMHECRPPRP